MVAAASRHLPHFALTAFNRIDLGDDFAPLADMPGPVPEQSDALESARAEALAEARAEFEQIRAADRAEHERCLVERERQFAETTGGVLLGHLSDGLARIERTLCEEAAHVLARFLDTAVRERALAELSETVAALVAGAGAVTVKVAGPEPLLERLREGFDASRMPAIELTVNSAPEVTVTIDDTIIETRIAAWMNRVNAAVGGEGSG